MPAKDSLIELTRILDTADGLTSIQVMIVMRNIDGNEDDMFKQLNKIEENAMLHLNCLEDLLMHIETYPTFYATIPKYKGLFFYILDIFDFHTILLLCIYLCRIIQNYCCTSI